MAGKFSIEAVFTGTDHVTAVTKRIERNIGLFSKASGAQLKEFTSLLGSMAKVAAGVGVAIAGAATVAGAALFDVAKTGADFEEAITAVGAVSLMTRDQVADLEKKALELGASTKFSATEVANGMELMGRAGFTNAEILQGIGGVLNAAAAEGSELAETAGIISNVLKGMGLATTEATNVADVLTLASARTNSSISSLGESMKNVSSTARQFKIPLTDAVAAVALLQDVGLDASEAGSAFNTMLTKMAAPTDDIKKKMKEMGVSFQDAHGNMLPLADVFAQLQKSAEKSGGNMEQVAFFADLVGLRGQKAAGNLKDLFSSGKFGELAAELKNASGSAEKMAALRMNNLKGDVEQLGGAVDSLKIALFNTQSGPLRGIVQGMTKWLEANQGLIVSGFADFVAGVGRMIPKVVAGFKQFADIVRPIGQWFSDHWAGVKVVLLGVAAALGVLAVGAAAMLAPMYAITAAFFYALGKMIQFGEWIYSAMPAVGAFFSSIWTGVITAFKSAWESIKAFFTPVVEFLVGYAMIISTPYRLAFELLRTVFGAVFDFIVAKVTAVAALLMPIFTALGAFFTTIWNGVAAAFAFAWDTMVAKALVIIEVIKAIWAPLGAFFQGLWNGIAAAFQATLGWVISKIDSVVSTIRGIGRETMGTGESAGGQMVSPQARTAASISQTTTVNKGELTVKAPANTVSGVKAPAGMPIKLQPSGAF